MRANQRKPLTGREVAAALFGGSQRKLYAAVDAGTFPAPGVEVGPQRFWSGSVVATEKAKRNPHALIHNARVAERAESQSRRSSRAAER